MSEPVADPVVQLRVDVDALAEAVTGLVELIRSRPAPAASAADAGPSRWAWRYAGGEGTAALWRDLREFVDWLNRRYAMDSERQIPPCWYRHSVAVEELTALMASWQAAYHGPDDPRGDMLTWHAYSLWPTMDRLAARAGWQRCRGGQHQDRVTRVLPTDDGFAAFVAPGPASAP